MREALSLSFRCADKVHEPGIQGYAVPASGFRFHALRACPAMTEL